VTLALLARQGGLVAVDKPPGLMVLPGSGPGETVCARELLAAQLGHEVWLCHRLDRDTSGVLLFATDLPTLRTASQAFEQGGVRKRYLALVRGRVRGPLDIDLPLASARKGKMRVALAGEEGKPSRTLVTVRELFAKASLVECEPLTGRQHQLRVHLRAKGHPLLVDHQYGRREPLLEKDLGGASEVEVLGRTPLHALRLELPALGFVAEAPLPADMARAVELLRAAP
jgi:tRNA pseudouridine32 synthase/23S rRNA pseudouridine746 synthase/23S rRNA pseudouridine955/2504/2580 synthase